MFIHLKPVHDSARLGQLHNIHTNSHRKIIALSLLQKKKSTRSCKLRGQRGDEPEFTYMCVCVYVCVCVFFCVFSSAPIPVGSGDEEWGSCARFNQRYVTL